jgi:hypothetical protein
LELDVTVAVVCGGSRRDIAGPIRDFRRLSAVGRHTSPLIRPI